MKYADVKNLISKDILLDIYPTNSDTMICEKFQIPNQRHLIKLLGEYGIERHTKEDNTKLTCICRYGVDSVSKAKEVQEKIKQTNIEKY